MEAPVCALADAMFRLPGKLDALLVRHGHMLPRGAADVISLIKQDLENMVSILQEHGQSGAQDRAMMVKCLTKEVRELSYDMEDSVDQYEDAAGTRRWILSPRRKKYKITRHRHKTAWRLPEKLKWRLWMASKIREFSVRSQEALQRYSSFNHPGGNGISSSTASTSTRCEPVGISSSTLVSFGSWHPTPYGEPVGIIAPLKKLEEWLDKNGEQKLKVVSVVGSGGIGKTTLANELYRRIGGQFECRAFVRTSRKPDVRRLLVSMLSQVWPRQTPHSWKVHNLIAHIRTHLQDKRYLIIIDDIWDMQTWDIINRALPDGNLCSGILVTTEAEDVALKCCGYDSKYVFTMKPLGHDDSSKLFFNTAFGPKYECPSELSEVANSIIKKCAGLPLAMVIVANILVNQMGKPEQWDYVNKCLGYGLRTNPNSEGMKQVLNLSYNSLPEHLKPCVMYLSIYEEDYIVQKDDMVNQWLAEGFIRATEEKDKEEISRSYFDGLISSRMIQPVHVNDNDDVLSCSVHYMVLDFVTHKSIEENFVTAIDHCQTTARLADKVRRLSLHFGNAEATPPTNMRLSQVRTLAFFGVLKCLPSIAEFRLLQVLILHLWVDDDDDDDESIIFDLTRISELFRLRYLHVKCNVTLKVQQLQMRALQCLETLKIDARVSAVPSDIVHLTGLLHLSLPIEVNLPNGIGHMTSLCTLGYFDLSLNSTENVQRLAELTNLRDLRLTCSIVHSCYLKSKMDSMGYIIAKLRNLRSLTLEPSSIPDVGSSSMSISCDWLSIVSSPPAFLQRFEWLPRSCTFSSLPQWIQHLDKLCILKIGVRELARNDVDVLIGLPALTVLSLYVRTKPAKNIVFNKTGFSALKYFKFMCSLPCVEFEMDAMPNLRRLKLGFDAPGADQQVSVPVGIEHLSGLKEISAKIGGADDHDRTAAESALSYAIEMHPAHPTCNIQRVDWMFTGKDDNSSRVQEEDRMTLQKQHEVLQKYSREDANKSVHGRSMDLVPQPDSPHLDGTAPYFTLQGGFGMSHQQALAQVTAQASHSPLRRFDHIEQPSFSAAAASSGAPQHMSSAPNMEVTISNNDNVAFQSAEASHRYQVPAPVDKPADDGYNWRKYGQKVVKGSDCPRSYYKCTHVNCPVKKKVEHAEDGQISEIIYKGKHNHERPPNKRAKDGSSSLAEQNEQSNDTTSGLSGVRRDQEAVYGMSEQLSGLSEGDDKDDGESRPNEVDNRESDCKRRNIQISSQKTLTESKIIVQTTSEVDLLDDGYRWRKYGQKVVKGNPHPRSYYKCTFAGCNVRKHIERASSDPKAVITTYEGKHNHEPPVGRGNN